MRRRRWIWLPSAGLVTPSLGVGNTAFDTTNFTQPKTFTGLHTSSTGKVLLLVQGRMNGTTIGGSYALGGTTLTQRAIFNGNLSGEAYSIILTGTGITTGSALDLVLSGGSNHGNEIVRCYDLTNWGGSVGVNAGAQTDTGTPSSITCTLTTLTGASSLLVGVGGTVNGGIDPYADSTNGWTHLVSVDTGTGNGGDSSAGFFSKTGGAAGGNQVFTPTGAGPDDQWSCAALELLAA